MTYNDTADEVREKTPIALVQLTNVPGIVPTQSSRSAVPLYSKAARAMTRRARINKRLMFRKPLSLIFQIARKDRGARACALETILHPQKQKKIGKDIRNRKIQKSTRKSLIRDDDENRNEEAHFAQA